MAGIIQPQPVVPKRNPLGSFLGGHNLFASAPAPAPPAPPRTMQTVYRLPSGHPTSFPPGSVGYIEAAHADDVSSRPMPIIEKMHADVAALGPPPHALEPIGKFLSRAGGNLAEDALNWPGGTAVALKGLGQDVAATVPRTYPGGQRSDLSFKHTSALGEGVGKATWESLLHPNRRPGDTLLNVFALLSAGAGAGARVGAAGGAIKAGEGVGAALTRPGYEGGSILHRPEPGTQRIYAPGGRPEAVPGPLEQAQAKVAALHNQLAENANRHKAAGLPVRDDVEDLAKQRDAMHEVGGRTPPPELNMQIRLGRERARIQAGIEAAQQTLEHHADLQAGVNRFPEAQGPRAAIHVDRLLSRNAFARQGQKLRNKAIQKALLDDAPTSARTAIGKALRELRPLDALSHLAGSPQSTFGREIRAEERIKSNLAQAPVTQLSHATEGIIGHGLSRGEHTAVGVVGVEGHHAFGGDSPVHGVETPADVIARHIKTHEGYIAEGKGLDTNAQHIADLKMAQQHLENPTPKFLRAVEFSRRASNGMAKDLIDEKYLTPETEAGRRAKIAAMYRGDRYNPSTPGREGVSPALDTAEARVGRSQKAYDALEEKGHRGGYVVSERPKTVQEATARYGELDAKLEKLRSDMAKKMYGEKGVADKLTPEEAAAQRRQNKAVGTSERERLGLTRTGMQAREVDEQLAAERERLAGYEAQIAKNKGKDAADRRFAADRRAGTERMPVETEKKLWNEYLDLGSRTGPLDAAARARLDELKKVFRRRPDQRPASEATAAHDRRIADTLNKPRVDKALNELIAASRAKIADLETKKLAFHGKRLKKVDFKKRGMAPGKAAPKRLVRDDRYKAVEAELDKILTENKGEPWAQELRKQMDEHDALEQALRPHSALDDPNPQAGQFGTVAASQYRRTTGTMERIGGATSVAKDDLEAASRAAANRIEPTGFSTNHPPPEGSFYFPLSRRFTDKTPKLGGTQARTKPGEFGVSPANEGAVISKQQFSGSSVEEARGLGQVARTIAQRATMIHRLIATKRLYERMWTKADPVRRGPDDIPMRYGKEIQSQLRDFFAQLADQLHATPDEEMKLNQTEMTKLQELLQPTKEHADVAVGATVPGVRWLNPRYLKSTGEINVRDPLQKLFDTVNNPIRMIQLYGRPAYILNLPGNLGMLATTDGLKAGTSLRTAVRMVKEDGADNAALVDAGMGTSKARSYDVGTGPLHETNRRLAETWNVITDMHARRAAFVTEAARAGFKTPADRARLLHDPKLETKKIEVFRRANKNMVDYDSLTPIEKTYIRRLIYFEPWVTRGTLWALRAMVENPTKAYTLNQLGRIGAEKAHIAFGDLPRWAKELGLIPAGKEHGGLLGTFNPSSMNTPATAVQVAEAIRHPLNKDVGLRNLVTPATGGATAALTGGAGEAPPKGVFKHLPIAGNMIESLPPIQAIRRSGVAPWLAGPPSKTYPDTGLGAALLPFAIGGAAKRDVSLPALHAQAEKQKPVDVRAADRVQHEQATLLSEARRVKLLAPDGQLPPDVVKAYTIDEQRKVAYAKLGANATQMQRLEADLQLGQKVGTITPQEANEWLAQAKARPADIAKARRWINDHRFGGKLLTDARTAVRTHGGDLHRVTP